MNKKLFWTITIIVIFILQSIFLGWVRVFWDAQNSIYYERKCGGYRVNLGPCLVGWTMYCIDIGFQSVPLDIEVGTHLFCGNF